MTTSNGDTMSESIATADLAQDWLDALSSGSCDEDAFLNAMQDLMRKDPDAGWDLLSLLDQYYRRGKIKPEVFRALKSNLEGQLLGAEETETSSPVAVEEGSIPAAGLTVPVITAPARTAARPVAPSAALSTPPAIGARIAATPAQDARLGLAVGDLLRGRYRIKSVVGRGGMSTVFEAIDQYRLDLPTVGQRLAIKVLDTAVTERPELLMELRREFQHLQSLSHPNIVRVYEYDRDGGTDFFTMEFLSGVSLGRVLSARHMVALDRSHALTIIRDVGAALTHAHDRGIVHGDLNPGNIFITDDGEVRVLDFGASQIVRRGPWISDFELLDQTPIATPRYASCEVLEGEPADVGDDLYAFGCIVYLLLAGKHPFGEHTAIQARTRRLKPARPTGLKRLQWRALRSALSFDRDRRPAPVEEWLKPFDLGRAAVRLPVLPALLKVTSRHPVRLMRPALTAGTMALLAAVGWWAATNQESAARTALVLSTQFQSALADAERSLTQLWDGTPAPATAPPTQSDSSAPPTNAVPPPARIARAKGVVGSAAAGDPTAGGNSALPPALPRETEGSALRSHVEFSVDSIEVPVGEPAAHVVVHRGGSLRGGASFSWWTEAGTANPGQDFEPVARHEERIADGKSSASLFVPVVADSTRRQPKTFYVVIGGPSRDVSVGARHRVVVTIRPSR